MRCLCEARPTRLATFWARTVTYRPFAPYVALGSVTAPRMRTGRTSGSIMRSSPPTACVGRDGAIWGEHQHQEFVNVVACLTNVSLALNRACSPAASCTFTLDPRPFAHSPISAARLGFPSRDAPNLLPA